MPNILGVEVSKKAINLALIHNAIEIATMAGWLGFVLAGHVVIGTVILAVGLTIEHIFALAAGKIA